MVRGGHERHNGVAGSLGQGIERTCAGKWHSAAIIHYLGDGRYAVGFAPSKGVKYSHWEWVEGLTQEQLAQAIAAVRLTRCPTVKVVELLHDIPK